MNETYVGFDRYQRYKTASLVIDAVAENLDLRNLNILEIGANENKDLNLFNPDVNIVNSDIYIPEKFKGDESFILADATNLINISDGEYDLVIALDILEHIPKEKREAFIKEINRVSRYGVFFSFPNKANYVIESEIRANAYFKALSGSNHPWLTEHREISLPDKYKVEESIKDSNLYYMHFSHGDIYIWEILMKLHLQSVIYSETIEYSDTINKYYNQNIYINDVSDKNYRSFYFTSKDEKIINTVKKATSIFVKKDLNSHIEFLRDNLLYVNDIKEKTLLNSLHNTGVQILNLSNALNNFTDKNIILEKENSQLEKENSQLEKENEDLYHKESILKSSLKNLRNEILSLQKANVSLDGENKHLQHVISEYRNSFFWKLTKPFRWITDKTKMLLKNSFLTRNIYKFLSHSRQFGIKAAINKTGKYFSRKKNTELFPTKEEALHQKNKKFSKDIKFSIVVPVFNPSKKFLKDMINSVLYQTYSNWELCLADGGDSVNVEKYIKKAVDSDSRIKYLKLGENKGISGNTNAGLNMTTGDYIVLLDHDDILHPSALFKNMEVIENEDADFIYSDEATFVNKVTNIVSRHYKPDFSPDTLRSYNYITHLSVFKKDLLNEVGNFRSEYDGSQDYDIILRLTEKAKKIHHIPEILYFWRSHKNSVAFDASTKPYTVNSAIKAIKAHLLREKLEFLDVKESLAPTTYKIDYVIKNNPLVSIIIPNKDNIDILKTCIDSILFKTTYSNYEIIIIENNSSEDKTFEYYENIKNIKSIKIINYKGSFNYSLINNYGAEHSNGEYLVLLNNDIEIITPNWIEEMLMFAQRENVGVVGAKLYYPDDTIQHAGVILGIGGVAGHSHKYSHRSYYGYMSRLVISQNLSAVTGACLMIRKNKFNKIKGFDKNFVVAFNDVDLCLRLREKKYLNVFSPFAEMYHYESKSRGYENTPEKIKRFNNEMYYFQSKWRKTLKDGDPYYNTNLTLDNEDFSIKTKRL